MKRVRLVVLLLIFTVAMARPIVAHADTVSIGIGSVPVTVASGTGTASFNGPSGSFSNIHITGNGQSVLVSLDLLLSDTIDTTTSGAASITIFITDQGLVAPLGTLPFVEGYTANLLPAGWTVVESTFVSATNALYSGIPLSSHTFATIGTDSEMANAATGGGPYSVTEEYVLTASSTGDANNTIDLSAQVPEPGVLAGLGVSLLTLGAIRERRKRSRKR
jgi:hypothetical protein